MDGLSLVLALYFAATLGVSGLAKLESPGYFADILRRQRLVPPWGVPGISRTLPWCEILIAVALVTGVVPMFVALLTTALFVGFLGLEALLLRAAPGTDCGCYGSARPQQVEEGSVATAAILAALSIVHLGLVARGATPRWEWRAAIGTPLALVGGFLAWRTWRREQRRRQLAVTTTPAAPPAGQATATRTEERRQDGPELGPARVARE